jgi:hypothetical protein
MYKKLAAKGKKIRVAPAKRKAAFRRKAHAPAKAAGATNYAVEAHPELFV